MDICKFIENIDEKDAVQMARFYSYVVDFYTGRFFNYNAYVKISDLLYKYVNLEPKPLTDITDKTRLLMFDDIYLYERVKEKIVSTFKANVKWDDIIDTFIKLGNLALLSYEQDSDIDVVSFVHMELIHYFISLNININDKEKYKRVSNIILHHSDSPLKIDLEQEYLKSQKISEVIINDFKAYCDELKDIEYRPLCIEEMDTRMQSRKRMEINKATIYAIYLV